MDVEKAETIIFGNNYISHITTALDGCEQIAQSNVHFSDSHCSDCRRHRLIRTSLNASLVDTTMYNFYVNLSIDTIDSIVIVPIQQGLTSQSTHHRSFRRHHRQQTETRRNRTQTHSRTGMTTNTRAAGYCIKLSYHRDARM